MYLLMHSHFSQKIQNSILVTERKISFHFKVQIAQFFLTTTLYKATFWYITAFFFTSPRCATNVHKLAYVTFC